MLVTRKRGGGGGGGSGRITVSEDKLGLPAVQTPSPSPPFSQHHLLPSIRQAKLLEEFNMPHLQLQDAVAGVRVIVCGEPVEEEEDFPPPPPDISGLNIGENKIKVNIKDLTSLCFLF